MGHEVAGLLAAEHHDREVRVLLDAFNERAKLLDGVGVEQG